MARAGKTGIDYFSHDVDMLQDKKIMILKAKHGLIGYAIFVRLLEELYRENYYLLADEDFNILFADANNIGLNVYIEVLNVCINKGLFNKKMYDAYSILTSKRIQMNYISATVRRKEIEFYREYLLVNPLELYNEEKTDVNIIALSGNIKLSNASNGTQSKEKGKEIESRVKDIVLHLNEKSGKHYKQQTPKTKDIIHARINEGFSVEDFKKVIDIKCEEWLGTEQEKYIRPETLFGNKFEGYLNQGETKKKDKDYHLVDYENQSESEYGGW